MILIEALVCKSLKTLHGHTELRLMTLKSLFLPNRIDALWFYLEGKITRISLPFESQRYSL